MIFPGRQKFNYDAALRYRPIVEKLEKSKWRKLTVLEVGSGTNGISDYYSGQVTGVDANFEKTKTDKNPNIKHIKGSIFKLPFREGSFYNVVCVDTLEHISSNLREKAVLELLRVTKRGGVIYLAFPTGNLSVRFEDFIGGEYGKAHNTSHIWLMEHKKNGLPDEERIISIFRNKKVKRIQKTGNVNLIIWFFIHWFFTVHTNNVITRFLKLAYYPVFFLCTIAIPPFYRTLLVIKK